VFLNHATFSLADISKRLLKASDLERAHYRVMASGYGIHWPLIDEDLSIDGLLGIKHRPPVHLAQQRGQLTGEEL